MSTMPSLSPNALTISGRYFHSPSSGSASKNACCTCQVKTGRPLVWSNQYTPVIRFVGRICSARSYRGEGM